MWFKNLTLYRLDAETIPSVDELEQGLLDASFTPCLSHQLSASGWIPPLGRKTQAMVHAVDGCYLFCLQQEEKVIPAGVLRDLVQDRVAQAEENEQRQLRKKEILQMKEDILLELTPRALTRKRQLFACIDTRQEILIINGGGKAAADCRDRLQQLSPDLGCRALKPGKAPSSVMTAWLDHAWPAGITPVDEIEMRDAEGVVKCKGQDLQSQEIRTHLEAGKEVVRIALQWRDRLQFTLCDDMSIRRLRFLDVVQEQLDGVETETDEAIFDAQFALMTIELRELIPQLIDLFACEK